MNPAQPQSKQEYSDPSVRPVAVKVDRSDKIEVFMTDSERADVMQRVPRGGSIAEFARDVISHDQAGLLPPRRPARPPSSGPRGGVVIRMSQDLANWVRDQAKANRGSASSYLVTLMLSQPIDPSAVERPKRPRRILDDVARLEVRIIRLEARQRELEASLAARAIRAGPDGTLSLPQPHENLIKTPPRDDNPHDAQGS